VVASTTPAWQVRLAVRRDVALGLADHLAGPDARTPSAPVPLLDGKEIYFSACADCHGDGARQFGIDSDEPGSPPDYSPRDMHHLITWGRTVGGFQERGLSSPHQDVPYTGRPADDRRRARQCAQSSTGDIDMRKPHPVFRAALTDTDRWAAVMYVYQAWIHPIGSENDIYWHLRLDERRVPTVAPEDQGPALFQRLCANCHGTMGYGNGPLSGDLLPHPRDLRDLPWQVSRSDARLLSVIRYGATGEAGAGVGEDHALEARATWTGMPGWSDYLDEVSIRRLLEYIRSFLYTVEFEEEALEILPENRAQDAHGTRGREALNIVSIEPDVSEWTWTEIRAALPDAPLAPPSWLQSGTEPRP
jgi:mono/diheme cytochrome c family protein